MHSAELLDILNSLKAPYELLPVLKKTSFTITDTTDEGDSVLHLLAKSSHIQSSNFSSYLKILMDAQADAYALDQHGRMFLSYLHTIESYPISDIILNLLQQRPSLIHEELLDGTTLINWLVRGADYTSFTTITRLLELSDINTLDENGSNYLQLAIIYNASNLEKIASLLSNKGIALTHRNYEGKSVFDLIIENKANRSVLSKELLIGSMLKLSPSSISERLKEGSTVIAWLFSTANYSVVTRIVLGLDDINVLDENGSNYLQLAMMSFTYKADEIASELILKGIDVTHKNNQGRSVFDLIVENKANRSDYANKQLMIAILKLHPSSLHEQLSDGTPIIRWLLKEVRSFIATLLELYPINTLDEEGNNFLQLAVMCSNKKDVSLLIEKGIDVFHRNKAGQSVFDLFSKEGKKNDNTKTLLEIIELHPASLLEHYSDGQSVLDELIKRDDHKVNVGLKTFLKQCQDQVNGREFVKHTVKKCFDDLRLKLIPETALVELTKALVDAGCDVDVEYCLAIIALCNPTYKRELNSNLLLLKPKIDLNAARNHIHLLAKEQSDEHKTALTSLYDLGMHLNDFDDATLAWEEDYFHTWNPSTLESDTVLFGHLFSLSDLTPVNDETIKLTGCNFSKTAPFMVHLMSAYLTHCEATDKHSEYHEAIRQVRNMTIKAMRFDYQTTFNSASSTSVDLLLTSMIEDSQRLGVEIITGWKGHAINLIIKNDNLYRSNGGGCSTDTTTEHYKITKTKNVTSAVLKTLYTNSSKESNKKYIQQDLHDLLGLQFMEGIDGTFQTVGNCSLQSMLIALKVKYQLFLPKDMADLVYADTLKFFEQFYLDQYLSRYSDISTLPHLLMRLIIQKLMPNEELELAQQLIKTHFFSEGNQEILHMELILKRWRLEQKAKSTEQFDQQLQTMGINLKALMSPKLHLLHRLITDKATAEDLETIKSWPFEQQIFQGYHLIHFAVRNNNLTLVSSLLQIAPEAVDQSNWYNEEPLCLVQSVEMIDLLVNAGAAVDRTQFDNSLDYAIKANRLDLVTTLIKHKAQPSEYSVYYAATRDHSIIHSLIEAFPSAITKPTHDYRTAIHAAAAAGHSAILHTLVYNGGADPDASDVNGVTPLQLALRHGKDDTVRTLLRYPRTFFNSPYRGDSVVKMAKSEELQQAIELHRQQKKTAIEALPNFKNSNPGLIKEDIDYLILAIRTKDLTAVLGYLITYPSVNVVTSSKLYCTSPLSEAIRNLKGKSGEEYDDFFSIIQMLLQTSRIDVNACMSSSEPLIFMATSINNVAVLELFLIDPKLNPNKTDNVGYTALHDAVERGHLDCVLRLLQDERVDSTLVNQKGKNPAQLSGFSYNKNRAKCIEAVIEHQQQFESKMSLRA